jgi:HK97 family phage major capsid protein
MTRKEKLADLQAKRQTALDAADKIMALASEGESLSPEQTADVKKHLDEVDAIGDQITAIGKEEAELASQAARLDAARKAPINAQVAEIVARGSGMSASPNGSGASRWTIPAQARKQTSSVTAFSDEHQSGGFTKEEKAYRFGQFALAKASIDLPGVYNFQQARRFADDHGMLRNSHLEGGNDTSGSHIFVPEEFGTDMIKLREEYGVARRMCKMVPMNSDTRTDPKFVSGLTSYFTGENSAFTASEMQHQIVRLTARKMTCLSTYSSELSEDSVIDFGNTLAQEMSYSNALKEDQCFIDGDGTSTYGHIRGLKTMFATLTLGTAPGYRDTTTSNTWAAIVIADLTSLIANVPVYAQAGMMFLCSSQFYYTVMVPLLNAAGGVTGMELQNGFRQPMFQGIPVMFSQVMGTATATSTVACFLGNFALGCSFGDRRRQTLEFSREATIGGTNLFEYDLVAVKCSQRIDINVHSIGSDTVAGPIVALSTGS